MLRLSKIAFQDLAIPAYCQTNQMNLRQDINLMMMMMQPAVMVSSKLKNGSCSLIQKTMRLQISKSNIEVFLEESV